MCARCASVNATGSRGPRAPGAHRYKVGDLACLHVCMFACLHFCMFACLHVCMFACWHVGMLACLHVCMFACLHVCMFACLQDRLRSAGALAMLEVRPDDACCMFRHATCS